jgi:hypothetical protein
MATPVILSWSDVNPSLLAALQPIHQIASSQPLTANQPLVFDNPSPFVFATPQPLVITSDGADLSGITFTITGTYFVGGASSLMVTVVIAGPTANNSVTTRQLFNTLISVVPDTTSASTVIVGPAPLTLRSAPFYFPNGESRTISLDSSANLSGVNFLITGFFGNFFTQEVLAGPNTIPVYSTNMYTSIVSIVPSSQQAGNVSVGSGFVGILPWVRNDYNSDVLGLGVQNIVTGTALGTVTYNFIYTNLIEPYSVQPAIFPGSFGYGIVMPNPGNADAYQTVMGPDTQVVGAVSKPANFTIPCRWYSLYLTARNAWGGTLTAYFTRQGIK